MKGPGNGEGVTLAEAGGLLFRETRSGEGREGKGRGRPLDKRRARIP